MSQQIRPNQFIERDRLSAAPHVKRQIFQKGASLKQLSVLFVIIFLSGCAASLLNIEGKIEWKTYAGEWAAYTGKNNEFSVIIPFKGYEYKYFDFKEKHADFGSEVVFGPGAYDKTMYRISIIKNVRYDEGGFENLSEKILSATVPLANQGGATVSEDSRGYITLNGKNVKHVKYTQPIQRDQAIPFLVGNSWTHHAYIFQGKSSVALLWVREPEQCNACQTVTESELRTKYFNVEQFVKSFQFADQI